MRRQDSPPLHTESYGRLLLNLSSVLAVLIGLGYLLVFGTPVPKPSPNRESPAAVEVEAPIEQPTLLVQAPEPVAPVPPSVPPAPPAPEPPKLDEAAIAAAQASVDAARQDRERAEARATEAAQALKDATAQATEARRGVKDRAEEAKDPRERISQASARGGFLKAESEKLKGEIATLAHTPRPRGKVLSNKNPVARPAQGAEHHFELRKDRVSYIDLDKLMDLVKSDARLRIRLSDGARAFDSKVGPVGAFSLQYVLTRSIPSNLGDFLDATRVNYELRGWEVIPEFEGRGEAYDATRRPVSEFARVVNRLNPRTDSITLWIYPDSFPLFRRLRDDLKARGFLVAARPLPVGMAIRGSPSGSLSAGQ